MVTSLSISGKIFTKMQSLVFMCNFAKRQTNKQKDSQMLGKTHPPWQSERVSRV